MANTLNAQEHYLDTKDGMPFPKPINENNRMACSLVFRYIHSEKEKNRMFCFVSNETADLQCR
jgi:hypothetical protein